MVEFLELNIIAIKTGCHYRLTNDSLSTFCLMLWILKGILIIFIPKIYYI